MAYNVVYKRSVHRDLKKQPKAEVRHILSQIEEELSRNADTYPVLKGQFAGPPKYRVGDYRMIFAVFENEVLVLRIGYRKDVDKKDI